MCVRNKQRALRWRGWGGGWGGGRKRVGGRGEVDGAGGGRGVIPWRFPGEAGVQVVKEYRARD